MKLMCFSMLTLKPGGILLGELDFRLLFLTSSYVLISLSVAVAYKTIMIAIILIP